jgi:hypothetical protein
LHDYQIGRPALRIIQKLIRLFSVNVYGAINRLRAITALLALVDVLGERRLGGRAPLVLIR